MPAYYYSMPYSCIKHIAFWYLLYLGLVVNLAVPEAEGCFLPCLQRSFPRSLQNQYYIWMTFGIITSFPTSNLSPNSQTGKQLVFHSPYRSPTHPPLPHPRASRLQYILRFGRFYYARYCPGVFGQGGVFQTDNVGQGGRSKKSVFARMSDGWPFIW